MVRGFVIFGLQKLFPIFQPGFLFFRALGDLVLGPTVPREGLHGAAGLGEEPPVQHRNRQVGLLRRLEEDLADAVGIFVVNDDFGDGAELGAVLAKLGRALKDEGSVFVEVADGEDVLDDDDLVALLADSTDLSKKSS